MKLSVIILNYKTKELTDKCLQSIYKNPVQGSFEVIVVDNNSQDDSVEFLNQKWSDKIKIISSKTNLGFGGGMNFGFNKAQGDYVLIMNPDIEVWPDCINQLQTFLDKNKKCALVGPQLIYPDKTIQDSYRKFPTLTDLIIKRTWLRKIFKKRMNNYLMHNVDNQKTQTVDWMVGGCLMMRKKFIKQVGGFDPRYFLFLEDTDLCHQAWQKDWEVFYLPQAKANHNHTRLSGNHFWDAIFKKTFYIHITSALKYWWKWMS